MENSITLYKAPWQFGDENQPYFANVNSREKLFSGFSSLKVNIENPNIQISFNYEISLKINIDVTVAEDYNYVIVKYNNKEYYAFIVDCEHISVGRTRIECYRHIMAELVDPFAYITDCHIVTASFSNTASIGCNRNFIVPDDIRRSKQVSTLSFTMHSDGLGNDVETAFRMFLILYTTEIPANVLDIKFFGFDDVSTSSGDSYLIHGCPNNGSVLVIPLESNNVSVDTLNNGRKGFSKITDDYDISYLRSAVSPYIISASILSLPVGLLSSGEEHLPFVYKGYCGKQITKPYAYILANDGVISNNIFYPTTKYSSKIVMPSVDNALLYNYEILITGTTGRFILYGKDFCGSTYESGVHKYVNEIMLEFDYILDSNGSSVCVTARNPNSLPDPPVFLNYGKHPYVNEIPLNDMASVIKDAESTWLANNKYYNAMTANIVTQKVLTGAYQATQNLAIGAVEIASGSPYGTTLGVGNVIRGITGIGDTASSAFLIDEQRRTEKLNEINKPDTVFAVNNASAKFAVYENEPVLITYTPFTQDVNNFTLMLHIQGINCDIRTFNVRSMLDTFKNYDNTFFVKMTFHRGRNFFINNRKYSELKKYLNAGCHFTYYE